MTQETNGGPSLWIVAGPDGAGKTTYAFRHIRAVTGSVRFVNLDEIARGLSPLDPTAEPQRAARVALSLIDELIDSRLSFSLETTLAGRTHHRTIAAAKEAGFRISLLYFVVAAAETCLLRVARRIAEGGHAVPEADVRRRFARSMANLSDYAAICDLWRVYDNNGGVPRTAMEGIGRCIAMRGDPDDLPGMIVEALALFPDCAES